MSLNHHKSATLPANLRHAAQKAEPEPEGFLAKLKKKFRIRGKGRYDVGLNTGECDNVAVVSFRKTNHGELPKEQGKDSTDVGFVEHPIGIRSTRSNSDRYSPADFSSQKHLESPSVRVRGDKGLLENAASITDPKPVKGNNYSFLKYDADSSQNKPSEFENVAVRNDCLATDDGTVDLDDLRLARPVLDDIDPGYETLDEVRKRAQSQNFVSRSSVTQGDLEGKQGVGLSSASCRQRDRNDMVNVEPVGSMMSESMGREDLVSDEVCTNTVLEDSAVSMSGTGSLETSGSMSDSLTVSAKSKDSGVESPKLQHSQRTGKPDPTPYSLAGLDTGDQSEEIEDLDPGYAECADAIKVLNFHDTGVSSTLTGAIVNDVDSVEIEPGYAECADAIKNTTIKISPMSRIDRSEGALLQQVPPVTKRNRGDVTELYANPQILFRKMMEKAERSSGEFSGSETESGAMMDRHSSGGDSLPKTQPTAPDSPEAPPLPARNYSLYVEGEEEHSDTAQDTEVQEDAVFDCVVGEESCQLDECPQTDSSVKGDKGESILDKDQPTENPTGNTCAISYISLDSGTSSVNPVSSEVVVGLSCDTAERREKPPVGSAETGRRSVVSEGEPSRPVSSEASQEQWAVVEAVSGASSRPVDQGESGVSSNCQQHGTEGLEEGGSGVAEARGLDSGGEEGHGTTLEDSFELSVKDDSGNVKVLTILEKPDHLERRRSSRRANQEASVVDRSEPKLTEKLSDDDSSHSDSETAFPLPTDLKPEDGIITVNFDSFDKSDSDDSPVPMQTDLFIDESTFYYSPSEPKDFLDSFKPDSGSVLTVSQAGSSAMAQEKQLDTEHPGCTTGEETPSDIRWNAVCADESSAITCSSNSGRKLSERDLLLLLNEDRVNSACQEDSKDEGFDEQPTLTSKEKRTDLEYNKEPVHMSLREVLPDCNGLDERAAIMSEDGSLKPVVFNYGDLNEPTHMSLKDVFSDNRDDLADLRLSYGEDSVFMESQTSEKGDPDASCDSRLRELQESDCSDENVRIPQSPIEESEIISDHSQPPPLPPYPSQIESDTGASGSCQFHSAYTEWPDDEAPPPVPPFRFVSNSSHSDDSTTDDSDPPPAIPPRVKIKKPSKPVATIHHDFMESMRQLKDCGWYWGPLSWEEAETKLNNKPEGSFLVRDSSDERYLLSLSFKNGGHVHHTRIEHHKGHFSFWSQPESHGRSTIKDFVDQCVNNSRNGRFLYFIRPSGPGAPPLPIHLLHPVSRFIQMQSLQHMCRFRILQLVRRDHIDDLPIPTRIKGYLKEAQYYVEYLDD